MRKMMYWCVYNSLSLTAFIAHMHTIAMKYTYSAWSKIKAHTIQYKGKTHGFFIDPVSMNSLSLSRVKCVSIVWWPLIVVVSRVYYTLCVGYNAWKCVHAFMRFSVFGKFTLPRIRTPIRVRLVLWFYTVCDFFSLRISRYQQNFLSLSLFHFCCCCCCCYSRFACAHIHHGRAQLYWCSKSVPVSFPM